ncbi:TIFY 6B-like protein [Drosera capensis]
MTMERDFMGLGKQEQLAVVKEEVSDPPLDSGSGVPWSSMNKGSATANFMPCKNSQDDRTKKVASIPTSSGFVSVNSAGGMQRNSFSKPDFNISAQTALQQQFLAGLSLGLPSPAGQIVGVTEPWYNFKASNGRGQMTIFYEGTVSVYDDISPERAQAIMLLAGNGSSVTFNPKNQHQATGPNPGDKTGNQPLNSQPCADPATIVHSGSVSNSSDEVIGNKPTGVTIAPVVKPGLQRVVSSLSPVPLTSMIPSAIPQARKASLARFLEKRKERMMSVAPYSCEKKPHESCAAANSEASLSATSTTTVGSASPDKENCVHGP